MKVYETDEVVRYLRKRNMLKPYLKAKAYFEAGHAQMIYLKNNKRNISLESTTSIVPVDFTKTTDFW